MEQRVDQSAYPIPSDEALATNFDLNNFQARPLCPNPKTACAAPVLAGWHTAGT